VGRVGKVLILSQGLAPTLIPHDIGIPTFGGMVGYGWFAMGTSKFLADPPDAPEPKALFLFCLRCWICCSEQQAADLVFKIAKKPMWGCNHITPREKELCTVQCRMIKQADWSQWGLFGMSHGPFLCQSPSCRAL